MTTSDKQIREMMEDPHYLVWKLLDAFKYAEPHLAECVDSNRLKLEAMRQRLEEVL